MHLTSEQLQALAAGQPVATEFDGIECVLIRRDVYDRTRGLCEDSLPPDTVASLVAQTMAEYDADDPLLDSYQNLRR